MRNRLEDDNDSTIKPCDCGSPTCNSLACIKPIKTSNHEEDRSLLLLPDPEEDLPCEQINSRDFQSRPQTTENVECTKDKHVTVVNRTGNWKNDCLCSLKDSKDHLLQKYIDHFNDHIHYTKYLQKLVREGEVKCKNAGTNMCSSSKRCKCLATKKRALAITRRIDQEPINFLKNSPVSCLDMTTKKAKSDTNEFIIIKCPITSDENTSYPTFSCVRKCGKRKCPQTPSSSNSLHSILCKKVEDIRHKIECHSSCDSFCPFLNSKEHRTFSRKDCAGRSKSCKQNTGTQMVSSCCKNDQHLYRCKIPIATQSSKTPCCSCSCETFENYTCPKLPTCDKYVECQCNPSICNPQSPKKKKRLISIKVIGAHCPSHVMYKRLKPTNAKSLNDKSKGLTEYCCKESKLSRCKSPISRPVCHDKIDKLCLCSSAECNCTHEPKSCSKTFPYRNPPCCKPKFIPCSFKQETDCSIPPCKQSPPCKLERCLTGPCNKDNFECKQKPQNKPETCMSRPCNERDICCENSLIPKCKQNLPMMSSICMSRPLPCCSNQERDKCNIDQFPSSCKPTFQCKTHCLPKPCNNNQVKENGFIEILAPPCKLKHEPCKPGNKKTQACQFPLQPITCVDKATDPSGCCDNDDQCSCDDTLQNLDSNLCSNLRDPCDSNYFTCCQCRNLCNNICLNSPFEMLKNTFACKKNAQHGNRLHSCNQNASYPFEERCGGPRYCMDVKHAFQSRNPDSAVQVNSQELATQAEIIHPYQSLAPIIIEKKYSVQDTNRSESYKTDKFTSSVKRSTRDDSPRISSFGEVNPSSMVNISSSADLPSVMQKYMGSVLSPKLVGTLANVNNSNMARQNNSTTRESRRVSLRYDFPVLEKSVSPSPDKENTSSKEHELERSATSTDSIEERIKNLRQNLEKQNDWSENSSQKSPTISTRDRAMSVISEEVAPNQGIQSSNFSRTIKIGSSNRSR